MYSTPFSLHTGTSSATSIGLEASEIWVSPWQKASKPSLVPEPPTLMRASGFSWRNNSAAACVIGCTVLDPSMRISPETGSPPLCCPLAPLPQPARTRASTTTRPATTNDLERPIILNPYSPFAPTAQDIGLLSGHDGRAKISTLRYTRVRT